MILKPEEIQFSSGFFLDAYDFTHKKTSVDTLILRQN